MNLYIISLHLGLFLDPSIPKVQKLSFNSLIQDKNNERIMKLVNRSMLMV